MRSPARALQAHPLALSLLGALAAAPASAQFTVAGQIAGPTVSPEATAEADLDGDGDVDLLLLSKFSSPSSGEVSWIENANGLGTVFQFHSIGDGLNGARNLAAADVDGDGDVDVLVAETSAQALRWYANDGAGSFGPVLTAASGLAFPISVFAGDIDADGDLDLFWNSAGGTVAWHENLGGGSFSAASVVTTTSAASDGLEIEDLDGDGDLDLFVPRGAVADPAWFENLDGLGTFGGPNAVVGAGGWFAVEAGDIDADGDVDLVGGNAAAGLAWVRNSGTGAFSAEQTIAPQGQIFAVLAADADLDGDLDVFASDAIGSGTQLFRKSTVPNQFTPEALLNTVGTPSGLQAPDLDGDGDGDLVSCSWFARKVMSNLNDGSGPSGFGPQQLVAIATGSPRDVLTADLDGDGDQDAITAYTNALALAWSKNVDGVGSFGTPSFLVNSVAAFESPYVSGVSAEDIDGDGDLDLAWLESTSGFTFSSSRFAWSRNDGSGGFGPSITAAGDTALYQDGAAADLDGDGDVDMAVASGPIEWYRNLDGLGTFGPKLSTAPIAGTPWEIEPTDLDGDGDLDLLTTGGHTVAWLVNDGTGGFVHGGDLVTGPLEFTSVASGDLDADGDLDVVSRGYFDDVYTILNLGAGAFAPASQTVSDLSGHGRVELHDLDGDGAADALLSSMVESFTMTGNGVQWLMNDGAGNLGGAIDVVLEPGAQWRATAVDLDLDGKLDVVWSDADSGVVAWSHNDLCPTIAAASEAVRLGAPPNPAALLPGVTSGPVVGGTWDPEVDHSSFLPSALVDLIAVGVGAANAPTPYGTLLVDVGQAYAIASSAPGAAFAIPVPSSCGLVGLPLSAQGASSDGTTAALTNGLDLVLGSY